MPLPIATRSAGEGGRGAMSAGTGSCGACGARSRVAFMVQEYDAGPAEPTAVQRTVRCTTAHLAAKAWRRRDSPQIMANGSRTNAAARREAMTRFRSNPRRGLVCASVGVAALLAIGAGRGAGAIIAAQKRPVA